MTLLQGQRLQALTMAAEFAELPAKAHSPFSSGQQGRGLECRVRAGRGLSQHPTFNSVVGGGGGGEMGVPTGGGPG